MHKRVWRQLFSPIILLRVYLLLGIADEDDIKLFASTLLDESLTQQIDVLLAVARRMVRPHTSGWAVLARLHSRHSFSRQSVGRAKAPGQRLGEENDLAQGRASQCILLFCSMTIYESFICESLKVPSTINSKVPMLDRTQLKHMPCVLRNLTKQARAFIFIFCPLDLC